MISTKIAEISILIFETQKISITFICWNSEMSKFFLENFWVLFHKIWTS